MVFASIFCATTLSNGISLPWPKRFKKQKKPATRQLQPLPLSRQCNRPADEPPVSVSVAKPQALATEESKTHSERVMSIAKYLPGLFFCVILIGFGTLSPIEPAAGQKFAGVSDLKAQPANPFQVSDQRAVVLIFVRTDCPVS